ncbi:hypothetical protein FRX31_006981 [Thalictrum thalictroides]|uniref:Uncharacterized protein n=1 Tax=Thalictrum thalictroides TaxID=46969 RepID=A0A7J6X500_THATH|nr:hypothetical protein FRX31_006981 [Thalictrum thalictroides]
MSLSIEKQQIKGLYAYDLLGNTIKDYTYITWISVDTYVESLVSIASLSDKGIKEDKNSRKGIKRKAKAS